MASPPTQPTGPRSEQPTEHFTNRLAMLLPQPSNLFVESSISGTNGVSRTASAVNMTVQQIAREAETSEVKRRVSRCSRSARLGFGYD